MSLFSSGKPQPLNSLVKAQFEAARRFLTGSPSTQDLRTLGYTQYCGSTSDCGYGSQCVDGLCTPIGNGNTQYGEDGCSSGSSTPPATLNCITCGYDGERSCAGTRSCTFTPYGVTCRCGGTNIDSEGSKNCNNYCTTQYASYGTYSEGCAERNTCSECYACDNSTTGLSNGTCVKKSRDNGAPCHCDPRPDESCEPRDQVPMVCCPYKYTCDGRTDDGKYCIDAATWFQRGQPKCYDLDYECKPPDPEDPDCFDCENFTTYLEPGEEFNLPEGCTQTGEIIDESTGRSAILYTCCEENDNCKPQCTDNFSCGYGYCCVDGKCLPCSPAPVSCNDIAPSVRMYYEGADLTKGVCECLRMKGSLSIEGYKKDYTNGSCTNVLVVDETSVFEIWPEGGEGYLIDCDEIAVQAGHVETLSSDPTEQLANFIPGDYTQQNSCGESGTIWRNAVVIVYKVDGSAYRLLNIYQSNFNALTNSEYYYQIKYNLTYEPAECDCSGFAVPQAWV